MSPRVTSHPPKVPHTLQIYTFFNHVVNPPPLLEAPLCLAGCPIGPFRVVLVPSWCLPSCPKGSFLPPWCFPGASQAVQLILSCLPGASQAVQLVLSCLPDASLAPLRLSKWSFPASLAPPCQRHELLFKGQSVLRAASRGAHPRICREPSRSPLKLYLKFYKIRRPSKTGIRSAILCDESPGCRAGFDPFLPPWRLTSCPMSPFLPPWCLSGCPNVSSLPPWRLASCPISPFRTREAPGRQEIAHWTACEAPGKLQGGSKI